MKLAVFCEKDAFAWNPWFSVNYELNEFHLWRFLDFYQNVSIQTLSFAECYTSPSTHSKSESNHFYFKECFSGKPRLFGAPMFLHSLFRKTSGTNGIGFLWLGPLPVTQLVSWSLTFLFSTNMAISETKGQGWKVIHTQWRKASDILTSTLATFLFSSHPKKGKGSRGSFTSLR